VLGPQPQCAATTEISVVHPPLAKWLIGAGIQAFGFTPAGWRVAPLIAGTLTVAVLYLLARRLLQSTFAAVLASGLLAFDPLHYLMSRIAMLDAFVVFFGLSSFLCLVYDSSRRQPDGLSHPDAWNARLFARPWLIGAGLAGGAATASKWSGGYLLLAVAMLAVLDRTVRARAHQKSLWLTVRREAIPMFCALVLVPAVVYVSSFVGRVDGAFMTWPWTRGSWLHGLVERHAVALQHHTGALYTHPYMSPPWSWPLVKRPVLFYLHDVDSGHLQEILALGNPLVWWIGLAALGVIAWRMVRQPSVRWRHMVILSGFLAGYLPWFIITRRESFLYYFLPAVPFLYLGLAQVIASIRSRRARATAAVGLGAASISF
jgi:dolichyl-phosphate-mannose--protein O-mannosyl transferase